MVGLDKSERGIGHAFPHISPLKWFPWFYWRERVRISAFPGLSRYGHLDAYIFWRRGEGITFVAGFAFFFSSKDLTIETTDAFIEICHMPV